MKVLPFSLLALISSVGAATVEMSLEVGQFDERAGGVDIKGTNRCPNQCSGHGHCHVDVCTCFGGYTGESCAEHPACPNQCSLKGVCVDENCVCYPGYFGADCSSPYCPNECSGHGACNGGVCECDAGWEGGDCSNRDCIDGCGGRGVCAYNGTCQCYPGYTGDNCEIKMCLNDCNGNGDCVAGTCQCHLGWERADCGIKACTPSCLHGTCVNGTCCCDDDFWGAACELRRCPGDCSGNGKCNDGTCECADDFIGESCLPTSCPEMCNRRGECSEVSEGVGTCKCEGMWEGPTCNLLPCNVKQVLNRDGTTSDVRQGCGPNGGVCHNGTCICANGWTGDFCNERTCPQDCNQNGDCDPLTGNCTCHEIELGYRWQQPACASRPCLFNCNKRGHCLDTGACMCFPGWKGLGCQVRMCPGETLQGLECSGNGVCDEGDCQCEPGYMGEDCAERSCLRHLPPKLIVQANGMVTYPNGTMVWGKPEDPNATEAIEECSGVGTCYKSECFCTEGRYGADCEFHYCPDNCFENNVTPRGACNATTGECACVEGFYGKNCELAQCPKNCSLRGICQTDRTCKCASKYSGAACDFARCPGSGDGIDCSGNGECVDGQCRCAPGFDGGDCSIEACPNMCNGNGACVESVIREPVAGSIPIRRRVKSCECDRQFTGKACDKPACGGNCVVGPCDTFGFGPRPDKQIELEMEQKRSGANGTCCNDHGYCQQAMCTCDEGWEGNACEVPQCPLHPTTGLECGGGGPLGIGECVKSSLPLPFGSAECLCYEGNDGTACERGSCKNGCGGNGVCFNESCLCFDGFLGDACQLKMGDKKCACNDRCQGLCLPACQQKHGGEGGDEVKSCTEGCMSTCNERCMKGDYLPTTSASYCESNECKAARRSRGKPIPYANIAIIKTPEGSLESNERPGPEILNNAYSLRRPGDLIKSLDFAADNYWGRGEPKHGVIPSDKAPFSVVSPKLDIEQLVVDGLSNNDIKMIISGPAKEMGRQGLKSPVGH